MNAESYADAYWVRIQEGESHLGAGFLLTRGFVLTALHVVSGASGDDVRLELHLPGGQRVPGRLCDWIEESDLALVAVLGAHAYDLPLAPPTDRPRPDVAWLGTYRPPDTKTALSGRVTHAPIIHRSDAHGEFTGLQMTVDQLVHDFAGYSGSPVHAVPAGAEPGERPVVGILMEQELSRADGSRDTNVVFAASVQHAAQRFPHFDIGHLREVAAGKPMLVPGSRPSAEPRPDPPTVDVDGYLKKVRQLLEDGLITPEEAARSRERASRALDAQWLDGASGD
ncbi:S1 family peptidase [Streptomyces aureocirculatus]|uniref:S1 family peptidase n=1 Tax=Streptomyces aureocirculatus TaxID=67275 RepID=UPI00068B3D87|nr:trypsin-like peptidase domain-containing protein [Streptomyces aureocirculatus]